MRMFLYRCYICGKEEIRSFNGDPPLIICENCDGSEKHVAMELVKEVKERWR